MLEKLPERVREKIAINGHGCWVWRGRPNNCGYGVITVAGKQWLAHRLTWTLVMGTIPRKLQIDHYRMNPGESHAVCSKMCVNPEHLEVVTLQENVRRGRAAKSAAEYQLNKTHCPCGLPYAGDNLYVEKTTGHRRCRACTNRRHREKWAKKKANKTA